jgi:hypothetical protein
MTGIIIGSLYHVAVVAIKVSKKEKEFLEWVNKGELK